MARSGKRERERESPSDASERLCPARGADFGAGIVCFLHGYALTAAWQVFFAEEEAVAGTRSGITWRSKL